MRRLWLQLAAAAVFLLALIQESSLAPRHDSGTFLIEPPTPYTRYLPTNTPKGKVLAIHGLDVSREVMSFISAALADGGFEVYAIDLPGHGASTVKFQTALAEQAIRNVAAKLGADTIVLGHSLGAGLLLDLAANQHFSTMVILSPPPMPIDEIRADRVLIAAGDIDIPRIRSFVPIAADIGGPQVKTWTLPWAAHSAAIFNPVYIRRIVEWVGGEAGSTRTLGRIVWLIVMFVAATVLGVHLLLTGNSPPRRGGVARSAGVVSSAKHSSELTTPSAPSAHPPLLCEEGNGSISRVTLKYLFNARLKASKPAPKLDVLAGTRNEWLRLITILFSLRKFLRGRDDRSKFRIAGPPVPETSSCLG